MKNKFNWFKIVQFIGGLKFSVIIIALFTIAMVAGTFLESYYGTDFASRVLYKAPYFMGIQLAMCISIACAAFLRFPIQKRLYGFYVVHAGLVMIGVGALMTFIWGIDGHIVLAPNESAREVVLSKDILKITYPEEGRQLSTFLPYTAFQTDLNQKYNDIELKKYLPFAVTSFGIPSATIPIQQDGSLIKGDIRAVEVQVGGQNYWVTNQNPLTVNHQGKNIILEVTSETLNLPFELALTEFKMEKAPGTSMPASYESFVKLFDGQMTSNHHIFMNNPLKFMGYTLYQSSYWENDYGTYNSVLSVNVDPGRPVKYLGSLMLVLGSIWHFALKNKKKD